MAYTDIFNRGGGGPFCKDLQIIVEVGGGGGGVEEPDVHQHSPAQSSTEIEGKNQVSDVRMILFCGCSFIPLTFPIKKLSSKIIYPRISIEKNV